MIVFEKFRHHRPLSRQAEHYAPEDVPISLATMADAAASCCAVLDPRLKLVEARVYLGRKHVLIAGRFRG